MDRSNRRPRAVLPSRRFPLLLLVAGWIALPAVGFSPTPARAQTLDLVGFGPLEVLPARLEDGTFIDPYSAAFAPAAANGYFALWFELPIDELGPGQLLGQRFDGSDLAVGTPRPIGTGATPSGPFQKDIQVRRQGGRLLAVWRRHNAPTQNVFARFLNAQGAPTSPVRSIGTAIPEPAVALLDSGRSLVVWQDADLAAGRLVGRTLDPNGALSPLLFLADGSAHGPALGADAQDRFLVVWQDFRAADAPSFDLLGRWLDSDGRPTGAPFVVTHNATSDPALAVWADGRSAVAWSICSDRFQTDDCVVRLRRFDADGQPLGPSVRLSPDDGRGHTDAEMAIGPDGTLFVGWQACPADLQGNPAQCRFDAVAFDQDGHRLATATPVVVAGEPVRRRVVALTDDFLVSWYSFNAQPDGVFVQRYRFTPEPEEPPPPPPADPPPPAGVAPLTSPELPGFRFWVEIGDAGNTAPGAMEPACLPETICVSGALPGRSEVFLRVVGPKPNGYLWPTLVKFTTSRVQIWIEQVSTGMVQYYELEGAAPGSSDLPGLFDRMGFQP